MLLYTQEFSAVGELLGDLHQMYLYIDGAFLKGDGARVSVWDDAQSELIGVGQR